MPRCPAAAASVPVLLLAGAAGLLLALRWPSCPVDNGVHGRMLHLRPAMALAFATICLMPAACIHQVLS